MLQKNHNEYSKQFMQKILLFIDSVVVNAVAADSGESNKILTAGLLNARDAICSEIIRDSQVSQIEKQLNKERTKKSQETEPLSQEAELEKDQTA